MNIFTVNCWKDKNKEKEAENGSILKKTRESWIDAESVIALS